MFNILFAVNKQILIFILFMKFYRPTTFNVIKKEYISGKLTTVTLRYSPTTLTDINFINQSTHLRNLQYNPIVYKQNRRKPVSTFFIRGPDEDDS